MLTSFARLSLAAVLGCTPLVLTVPAAAGDPMSMPGMDMGEAGHHAHAHHFSFGAPAHAGKATRTVRIGIGDLSYDTSEITVRAGETVRFVLTNHSAFEHEFAVADARTQTEHRAEMAEAAAHNEAMQHDDPNVVTVKPGQTAELTWRFGAAGRLEFDCNIPGHYESGMKGTIVVR
jgi:uncharacterized cupredoxin-like copper-binding protein